MIDEKLRQEILDSIDAEGVIESHLRVNENLSHVISHSSGLPRIQSNVIKKFKLILSQPSALRALSALSIRCAACGKVITYPAWYYRVKYAVNEFHYFVCFSEASPNQPNTHCVKKG